MTSEETKTATVTETKDEKKPVEEAAPKDQGDEKKEEATTEAKPQEDGKATEQTPATPAQPPKPTVHKANYEKDVVYLYQFCRTPFLPSVSPYCLKVETWLRLAGLKYENVDHKMKFRSKKGQLPFIELNGEEIPDSAIIIKELSQRFDKDIDACLTNDQKSLAHAMISMIENHLLWVVIWWRSKYPDNMIKGYKLNIQQAIGSKIPQGILNFFFKFNFGRKGVKKVKAHGIGVHKPEEILEFGKNDLKVLSDMLADKPFFFGDEPTTLDVVAFANLAQIHFIDKETPYALRDYMVESCANLVGLVNRMKDRCFPDWEEMCKNLDLNSHLPKPPPVEEKESKEKEGKDTAEEKKEEKEGDKEIEKKELDKDVEKDKAENEEKKEDENKSKEEKETK